MKPPYVVLLDRHNRYLEPSEIDNADLLRCLRSQPPAFIREAVEAELLLRLDAWAMGATEAPRRT